jgi:hypothetical protein
MSSIILHGHAGRQTTGGTEVEALSSAFLKRSAKKVFSLVSFPGNGQVTILQNGLRPGAPAGQNKNTFLEHKQILPYFPIGIS